MNASRQKTNDREASLRRVAIVLSSLPTPLAAKLLSSFDQDKRSRLRKTMTGLSDVDPLERKRALNSFSTSVQQHSSDSSVATTAEDDFSLSSDAVGNRSLPGMNGIAPDVLPNQPSNDKAPEQNHPLGFLGRVPNPQVIDILRQEHPQTVAVVLASIPPEDAAQLIPGLPRQVRDDVIRRIGRMNRVAPEMLSDVADLLKAKCLEIDLPSESASGGHALRAIMAKMQVQPIDAPSQNDASAHTGPSSNIETTSPKLKQDDVDSAMNAHLAANSSAPVVQDSLELHRDGEGNSVSKTTPSLSTDEINSRLQTLSPLDLCAALGRVSARDALLTLCGMPIKQANRSIAMLPKAQQKSTREQLANLGPLQLSEIDRAKEQVALASLAKAPDLAAA